MDLANVKAEATEDATTVEVSGEIDLSNSVSVQESIAQALQDARVLVVDLQNVRFIDSSGIKMLFDLNEMLKNRRRELRIVAPPGSHVRKVLELVALDEVGTVLDE